MNSDEIARVCHEANRALQQIQGADQIGVAPPWDEEDPDIKASAVNGVEYHLTNVVTPEQSHENWLKFKEADGWVYGPVKDVAAKQHPCMVPYNDLPFEYKIKDALFSAIVGVFKNMAGE